MELASNRSKESNYDNFTAKNNLNNTLMSKMNETERKNTQDIQKNLEENSKNLNEIGKLKDEIDSLAMNLKVFFYLLNLE